MPASTPIVGTDTAIYFVGDTKRFRTFDSVNNVGATKDGVLWSTLAAATLYLVDPNGVAQAGVAAAQEAPGIFHADVTLGNVSGTWHRYWTLTEGSVTLTWGRVQFFVRDVS